MPIPVDHPPNITARAAAGSRATAPRTCPRSRRPRPPAVRIARRYTTRAIAGPGRLEAELTKVLDARIGCSQGELTAGRASVAAPVLDAEHRFVAALGVLAPEAEQVDRLAPAVRRAADTISRRHRTLAQHVSLLHGQLSARLRPPRSTAPVPRGPSSSRAAAPPTDRLSHRTAADRPPVRRGLDPCAGRPGRPRSCRSGPGRCRQRRRALRRRAVSDA
ncbi:IclR family transcriptional regulator C-terminal domain-containing protein [Streptomyces bottropensis]|uniref:IclR family transcriptional regulator domain-containing protein n=1 Tax=Streptomyces bottropensis TaxID=42235 RepID=UPI0036C209A4